MAVQYAPTKLRVPQGFQNLLEGLAREVLREQPDDIIVFAKKYFQKLIARREGESKEEAEKPQEKSEPEDRSEKTETDQIDPRENEAAAKIQAGFRGHKTREELKQNKEQTKAAVEIQSEKQEDEKKPESQETSQAQTEKPAEIADKIDINVEDPEVQDAALKIQASFRGHKAREEVKALRTQSSHTDSKGEEKASEPSEEGKAVDIDIDDPEVQEAALKIQASFRGYKARESVKSMKSQEESHDVGEPQPQEGQGEIKQMPIDGGGQEVDEKVELKVKGEGMGEQPDQDENTSEVKTEACENKSQEDLESKNEEVGGKLVENEGEVMPKDQEFSAEAEIESREGQLEGNSQELNQDVGGENAEGKVSDEPDQTPATIQGEVDRTEQGGADLESQDKRGIELESQVVSGNEEQADINLEKDPQNNAAAQLSGEQTGELEPGQQVGGVETVDGSEDAVPSVAVTGDTDEQTEAVAKDEPLESAGSAGDGQQEGAAPTLDGEGEQDGTAPTLDGEGEQEVTAPTLDGEGDQNEGQTAEQGGSEQADQGQDGTEEMVTQENESSGDQEPALEETVETKQDG